ncbi:MAG: hypothetical protein ACE5IP_09295 [Terriglobia bacterium]
MTRSAKREVNRRALADPEVRKRMSDAIRRALADPEVRKRMSEARRRFWQKVRTALCAQERA